MLILILLSATVQEEREAFKQQTFSPVDTSGIILLQQSTRGTILISMKTSPRRPHTELERGEGGEGVVMRDLVMKLVQIRN